MGVFTGNILAYIYMVTLSTRPCGLCTINHIGHFAIYTVLDLHIIGRIVGYNNPLLFTTGAKAM